MREGTKTFEVRVNDRDYQTGDEVRLQEYDPRGPGYTGREIRAVIGHVMKADATVAPFTGAPELHPLQGGWVVFSLLHVREHVEVEF